MKLIQIMAASSKLLVEKFLPFPDRFMTSPGTFCIKQLLTPPLPSAGEGSQPDVKLRVESFRSHLDNWCHQGKIYSSTNWRHD
jgi:hypothetical protein